MNCLLGLDLGQAADPTAIAVLEQHDAPNVPAPEQYQIVRAGEGSMVRVPLPRGSPPPARALSIQELRPSFHCRHLERMPLGTPYPAVATHVAALLDSPQLKGVETSLVVDATGVGRPVVDMLRQRGLSPIAITITGGDLVTYEGGGWRVPKRDLVGVVQVALQTDRLKFAKDLPAVPVLVQELLNFRVKIDPLTAHDSYGSWREGTHDDLVLALACALWFGERWEPRRHYRIASSHSSYTG